VGSGTLRAVWRGGAVAPRSARRGVRGDVLLGVVGQGFHEGVEGQAFFEAGDDFQADGVDALPAVEVRVVEFAVSVGEDTGEGGFHEHGVGEEPVGVFDLGDAQFAHATPPVWMGGNVPAARSSATPPRATTPVSMRSTLPPTVTCGMACTMLPRSTRNA